MTRLLKQGLYRQFVQLQGGTCWRSKNQAMMGDGPDGTYFYDGS